MTTYARQEKVTSFGFVHGAWHGEWCWHWVADVLKNRGHQVRSVNLPCDDPEAGLNEYADAAASAFGGMNDIVVVAHSLGGLTAPMLAERLPVAKFIYLAAALPLVGESYAEQLRHDPVRHPQSYAVLVPDELGRTSFDLATAIRVLFHDLEAERALYCFERLRAQSLQPASEVSALRVWPATPASYICCAGDRALNPAWEMEVPAQRYGMPTTIIPGGHSPWASRPAELAELLLGEAEV